ncbi:MAG: cbb3-type cytochrome oxidase assembly protein CcoS [Cytophagales bacterium]|nr:MAG: cbb3-type cytochrome oxidase assembly protein CcoS [Cytophagales bacterium]
MSVIVILIILAIAIAGGFLYFFFWAVRSGQYDDMHSPSVRILFDENKTKEDTSQNINENPPSS